MKRIDILNQGGYCMEKKIRLILSIVTIIIVMVTTTFIYSRRDNITWVRKLIPITRINTDKKVVAIACNVYEGKEELKKIVEILKRENVKITFFIGGVWAKNNPDTLLMLKKNGHDIQNHGYFHKKPSALSIQNNIKEIKDTENLIYNVTSIKTFLFEPPFGDYDDASLNIINKLGYKTITWSIDTIDWRDDATEDIIMNRIIKKLHPGAIILTHPMPVTTRTIGSIISYLKKEGYSVVTVKELIHNDDY